MFSRSNLLKTFLFISILLMTTLDSHLPDAGPLIEERSICADGAAGWTQRYPSQTQRRLQMQLCHKQLQYRC